MQDLVLHSRFTTIESRLQILETAFHLQGPHKLNARFSRIEAGLARLEAQYGLRQAQHKLAASAQASQHAGSAVSGMQHCLTQELQQRGVSGFKFVRVPGDYYEQPLEFRSASWQHHSENAQMLNKQGFWLQARLLGRSQRRASLQIHHHAGTQATAQLIKSSNNLGVVQSGYSNWPHSLFTYPACPCRTRQIMRT